MADKTAIEWTDRTWNPIVGCSRKSTGCEFCYAEVMAARLEAMGVAHYAGTTRKSGGRPKFTGKIAQAPEKTLTAPLRWRKPSRIFVNSMSDLFHENVPDELIDKVFAVMALAPQHQFQVLTKRAERMRDYLNSGAQEVISDIAFDWLNTWRGTDFAEDWSRAQPLWPFPNAWLGVSVEDQERADERIPHLLSTPAAVRFLSVEPLLGAVDLHEFTLGFAAGYPAQCVCGHGHGFTRCPNTGGISRSCHKCNCINFRRKLGSSGIDWVIVGGESGPRARPMHPDWARSIRDQCQAAGVPYFHKQNGAYREIDTSFPDYDKHHVFKNGTVMEFVGKKRAGRRLDGVEHNDMPVVA